VTDTPPETAALVPPYPNLGPEPMEEGGPVVGWWLAAAALALGLSAIVAVLALRRRQGRAHKVGGSTAKSSPPLPCPGDETDGRERLIALAEAVRAALVARFGEGWRAKTTEEVADAPDLRDALGPDAAARLVTFLRLADLAKFSGDRFDAEGAPDAGQREPAAWYGSAAGLVSALATPACGGAAGARSRIKGK
jgi:hypothetical protein